jgi:Ca2+-binding RTX toxin-like protein
LSATAAIACVSASGASAATIAVHGETAIYRAGPGEANDLQIGIWQTQPCTDFSVISLCVSDIGAPLVVGAGCDQLDGNLAACPEESDDGLYNGRPVRIVAGDGDDAVDEESYRRELTIRGGSGDDDLHSGSYGSKNPLIYGGQGDDSLSVNNNGAGYVIMHGGPGDDEVLDRNFAGGQLYGEAGDDTLVFGTYTTLTRLVDGGPGRDVYRFSDAPSDLAGAIAPGPGIDTLDGSAQFYTEINIDVRDCHGCVERVFGGDGGHGEHIAGDIGREVLWGGGGPDDIRGRGGSDVLAGQDGYDTIYARDHAIDRVSCGEGVDTVFADGKDIVRAGCEQVEIG